MQKTNIKKLRRECVLAVLIPTIIIGIFQTILHKFTGIGLLCIGIASTALIFCYLARIFSQLDDMTWQQQLNIVIQKVSTPVMVANLKHQITYISESFYECPFSELLSSIENLPELLALKESPSPLEYQKQLENFQQILNNLNEKFISQMHWEDHSYEWHIIPLFSPEGVKWGTLVECIKRENEDLKKIEEFQANSGVKDKAELALEKLEKEIMLFNEGINQLSLYPQEAPTIIYEHPVLNKSMSFARQLVQKVDSLFEEMERLKKEMPSQSSVLNAKMFAPLQQVYIICDSIARKNQDFTYDFSNMIHELSKLKRLVVEQKGLIQVQDKSLQNTIQTIEQGLFQSIMLYEEVTLSLHLLHENQHAIAQLNDLAQKMNNLINSEGATEIQKNMDQLITLNRHHLSQSKYKLTGILNKLDSVKSQWESTLESVGNGLKVNEIHEHSSLRWSAICEAAEEHANKVSQRVLDYHYLTQKMMEKTALIDNENQLDQSLKIENFEKVVIGQKTLKTNFVLVEPAAKESTVT